MKTDLRIVWDKMNNCNEIHGEQFGNGCSKSLETCIFAGIFHILIEFLGVWIVHDRLIVELERRFCHKYHIYAVFFSAIWFLF